MSTYGGTYGSGSTVGLSLQEALARELIHQRVAERHHVPKPTRVRRGVRAAHLLRSIAERLDPAAAAQTTPAGAPATAVSPHAGSPRPWSAQPRPAVRRAPHRHS